MLEGGRSESHDGVNPSRARGRRGWKEQPALACEEQIYKKNLESWMGWVENKKRKTKKEGGPRDGMEV